MTRGLFLDLIRSTSVADSMFEVGAGLELPEVPLEHLLNRHSRTRRQALIRQYLSGDFEYLKMKSQVVFEINSSILD